MENVEQAVEEASSLFDLNRGRRRGQLGSLAQKATRDDVMGATPGGSSPVHRWTHIVLGSHTCLSWSSARRRLSASGSKLATSKPLTAAESMVKALIEGLFGPGGRVVALVVVVVGDKTGGWEKVNQCSASRLGVSGLVNGGALAEGRRATGAWSH